MLTGFEGVRYGLIVPKKESRPAPKKGLSVFGEDDSGDEKANISKNIERQAQRKLSDQKVAKLQAAALSEDPSIFDYDSHYDTMQTQREASKPAAAQARKSRYIESLLDKNKERQKEQDIIYERRLLRERKAEDHLFGDKDKFVTAAYKKKLEEDKKWLEEEALREQKESQEDVRKRGHMGDFYRNLLTNNVAFGTAKSDSAPPKSGSQTGEQRELEARGTAEASQAAEPSTAQPTDPKWEEMRRAREAYEARQTPSNAAEASDILTQRLDRPKDSRPPQQSEDKYEVMEKRDAAAEGEGAALQESSQPEQAVSKVDKAAAARERYLARKRKAPG